MVSFAACWEASRVTLLSEWGQSFLTIMSIYLLCFISGPGAAYCDGFRLWSLSCHLSTDVVPYRKLICNHWAAEWSPSSLQVSLLGLLGTHHILVWFWSSMAEDVGSQITPVPRLPSSSRRGQNSLKQHFWPRVCSRLTREEMRTGWTTSSHLTGLQPVARRRWRWPSVTSQRASEVVAVNSV